jgi:hypothetical protein
METGICDTNYFQQIEPASYGGITGRHKRIQERFFRTAKASWKEDEQLRFNLILCLREVNG